MNVSETVLNQDNKSTILLAINGRASSTKRTKHIQIRYYYAKDKVDKKEIEIRLPNKGNAAKRPWQNHDLDPWRRRWEWHQRDIALQPMKRQLKCQPTLYCEPCNNWSIRFLVNRRLHELFRRIVEATGTDANYNDDDVYGDGDQFLRIDQWKNYIF